MRRVVLLLLAPIFIAACAGGDLATLTELLDEDVVGAVDLGAGMRPRPPVRGRDNVTRGLLVHLSGRAGITLVSHPVNGQPGALAFRDRVLDGLVLLTTERGVIVDIHVIQDPRKLASIDAMSQSRRLNRP